MLRSISVGMSIACALSSASAFAATAGGLEGCAALLDPTKIALSHSVADTYAYTEIAQSNSNSNNSFGLGVVLPINGVPIGANANSNSTDVQSHLSNVGLNWSHDEQLGYAVSYIPRYAGDQFNTCIKNLATNKDSGVSIDATGTSDDGAIVTVSVHPTPGPEMLRRRLKIWTNGSSTDDFPEYIASNGTDVILNVARPNKSKDLIIKAEIDTFGGTPISTQVLVIPWKPIETTIIHSPPKVDVRCGGSNWGKHNSEKQAVVVAGPNEMLFPDTILKGVGDGIPANSGNHPGKYPDGAPADSRGFDIAFSSPVTIGGNSWCQVQANENPGYSASFVVTGKSVSRPADSGPAMSNLVPVKSHIFG